MTRSAGLQSLHELHDDLGPIRGEQRPPDDFVTVEEVARIVGVSERTVAYDKNTGRLRTTRSPNGQRKIPRSALTTYRAVSLTAGGDRWLLTVREVIHMLRLSKRTVRRRIREGKYVAVRVSSRRLLIDAERSRVGEREDGTAVTMAEALRALLPDLQRVVKLRTNRQEYIADSIRHLARLAQDNRGGRFFTVPEISQLSTNSKRTVYHDVTEGALPAFALARPAIRVRWVDAIKYANSPDATHSIISAVVSALFGDCDVAVRAEIARGFAAWWASARHL